MSDSHDGRLENILGAFALALSDRMLDAVRTASRSTGASPAALVALAGFADGWQIGQLADAVGLTHSGAVRLVDRLEAAGLASRQRAGDARSVPVRLTRRGRSLAGAVGAARAAAIADVVAELGGRDRAALERLTARLVARLASLRLEQRGDDSAADPTGWMCRLCDFDACRRAEGNCPVEQAAH